MSFTLIEPYVRPTRYFSINRPRMSWRTCFFAMFVLSGIPLARIGLGNMIGKYLSGYFDPYAIIFAFSLWQTPLAAMQQQIVLLPVYTVGLVLLALFLHLMLLISRAKKASYAATLQCVCYATPCLYLSVFPYSGTVTAVIYTSIFLAYSLRATHRTSWSKVLPAIAMGVPVLFLVCSLLFP